MPIVTDQLTLHGRQIAFRFPNSGNMKQHLANIFAGKEYPLPPLPSGYQFHALVDIGANVGAAAIWFLSRAPNARITCFEPAKENFDCLQENLKPFPNAEVYHCGLFSKDREAILHLGASQCMQHSIVASSETGSDTETITLKCASVEFDRLGFDRISILKIDTEGCEVAILQDLGSERLARIDMIFLEWHSEEDRRRIDLLLADRFMLANASANIPHRGSACYLATSIAAQVPVVAALHISRPAE